MMKFAILLMVSYVFMFLVFSYIQDVEAANKRCHINQMYEGTCGNDGNKVCLGDFKNKKFKYDICQCTDVIRFSTKLPHHRLYNCSRPG
ncbi:PREDICTED: putative defensin-like protein 228 [Camelina sativa]|uniref:Defensin-like protein 228 n=1 Tax=Camelina sativa TaxID=90675 RepID=A0ABM1R7V7_CAMSA|nr:PREDICTED: putative defensin-like protein 228 [Camelina sativa]